MDYDSLGNLYVSDAGLSQIFQVSSAYASIVLFAGSGITVFSGDGGSCLNAGFDNQAISISKNLGNLYICDGINNRIRLINIASGIISTIAGNGSAGFSGDNGAAVNSVLNSPKSIAIDSNGNIYFSDLGNQRIRKIDSNLIITTIAGNGTKGFGGDNGPAINATFNSVTSLSIYLPTNDMYLVDQNNFRVRVIYLSTFVIQTIAGNGIQGSLKAPNNNDSLSELNFPYASVYDQRNNLWISVNWGINKVSPQGGIGLNFGSETSTGYSGDGQAAVACLMGVPCSLIFDPSGNMLVGDCTHGTIRSIATSNNSPADVITTVVGVAPGTTTTGNSGIITNPSNENRCRSGSACPARPTGRRRARYTRHVPGAARA